MDILQPLPIEQWGLLRDSLRRDWPSHAYYYYLINYTMKWKKEDLQLKLNIFCPNGAVSAGTFIVTSNHSYCIAYIFTFEESKDLLRQVLKETRLINWSKYDVLGGTQSYFSDVLEDFIDKEANKNNFSLVFKDISYIYMKSKEECLQLEVMVPEECEIRHLNESHIPLIHSLWSYRKTDQPEKSIGFLSLMVKFNRGMGLFLKKDGSLVSWVLHAEYGGLAALQTVEEHKRKGYGKVVVKAMMKELAEEENIDSFAFVVQKNVAGQKFFESLEFKRRDVVTWYPIKPNKKFQ